MRVVQLKATRFSSPIGELTLIGRRGALYRVDLPQTEPEMRMDWLRTYVAESATLSWDDEAFRGWKARFHRYFSGRSESFTGTIDLRGSSFQVDVLRALMEVPYGHTISYGALAARAGHSGATQAVGQAVHANPLAIVVPCHRVIGADGNLVGYAAGLDSKRYLLTIEDALKQGDLFAASSKR